MIDAHPLARQRLQLRTWLVQTFSGRFRSCLSCLTCLSVLFVSRPSRSHLLLAFFAVLGFRVSLVNFTVCLAFLSLWTLAYCWHSSCFIVFEFLWLKPLYFVSVFNSCPATFLVAVQPNSCIAVFPILTSILSFKFDLYVVEVVFALLQYHSTE